MENSIKFDHIQNYPGRTGANIMYLKSHKIHGPVSGDFFSPFVEYKHLKQV